jgi:hypothetical protein
MKLPSTTNHHEINAFKKGYRLALDKRPKDIIPSTIKRHEQLRFYFEEGYQQAQDDLENSEHEANKPQWIKRFIWLTVMILGGLATAASIVNSYEKENLNKQPIAAKKRPNTTITELSLLSKNERKDLTQSRQDQQHKKIINTQSKIISSKITFKNPHIKQLNGKILDWQKTIPKNIKNITFKTEINYLDSPLKLQWIFKNHLIKEEKINKRQFSSKITLASNWSGFWLLQVINTDKEVLLRYNFNYIK